MTSWLSGGGLTIDTTSPAGDYLTAQGTVAQLDSLFGVTINGYSFQGNDFIANDIPPRSPPTCPSTR